MNHKEFAKEIFENKKIIKEKINKIYDNKKIFKTFMRVFDKIDLDKFDSLTAAEQKELMLKVFGNPAEVLEGLIKTELKKAENLSQKRIDSLANGEE